MERGARRTGQYYIWANTDKREYIDEERGDVFDEPYTGPFDLRVRSWCYAVNRTRHEFVDRRRGPISNVYRRYGRYEFARIDPTALLYARGTVDEEGAAGGSAIWWI